MVLADGVDRVAELEHELELLKLRLEVTRLVVMDMSRWVENQDDLLDLVIDDVVTRWLARDPDADVPARPGGRRESHRGLRAFWRQTANRVEYAPEGSQDEYRAEFCPLDGQVATDIDAYYCRVWAAHVAELQQAAGTSCEQS
jgi:hypothetical protein